MEIVTGTRFTQPEAVLSPKGSVAELKVLFSSGEDGWSLADMRWEGRRALGIRWNGGRNNPLGNPQSRGIATWFIVPDELAGPMRERYGGSFSVLDEHNSGITRVRLRPLPIRIERGEPQAARDDLWVLSITDRDRGSIEIMNPVSGHYMSLHRSHIHSLIPDSAANALTGPRQGILELTIQLTFEDGGIRIEPLKSFTDRIDDMFMRLWERGYENQQDEVRSLIADSRLALLNSGGKLGLWETSELDQAEAAVNSNFLRLALTAVKKAFAVHKLSPQEYEYGFNYGTTRRTVG